MDNLQIRRSSFIGFIISTVAVICIVLRTGSFAESLLFGVFAFNFLFALSNSVENIYYLFFLSSFFVFLLGRPFATVFLKDTSASYSDYLTNDARLQMNIVMIIGLTSIAAGYYILGRSRFKVGKRQIKSRLTEIIDDNTTIIRETVKPFVIVLYIVSIISNIERIIAVSILGYLGSYLTKSSLPSVVLGLSSLAPLSLAIYWATLPKKKETVSITLLFIITNCLSLFAGRRYEAISSIMVVVMYYILRNSEDEVWIKKETIVLGLMLSPVIMVLLIAVESWRIGGSVQNYTFFQLLGRFFSSVGGSSSVIGFEQMYHEELSDRGILFSFGNIWRSLNNNIIARFLFGGKAYQAQTAEEALHGYSMGAFLMYKIAPLRYLAGGGMGSCFLAELMCDFSYIGVALGSIILGIIIRRFKDMSTSVLRNFILVFSSMFLFRLPRDSFDYFLNQFISIKNILFVIVIGIAININTRARNMRV